MKFIILFLVSCSAFAQTKGVITDNSGNSIPYVSIFVENQNKTATSEENGTFSIQVSADAKLIFSALGFERKTVLASNAAKVVLESKTFELEDVVIKKARSPKILEIGQVENAILEAFDNGPKMDAKFIPYVEKYKKTKWIKKIKLFTDSPIEGATLKLHLYSVDGSGFPGEELLTQDLIVTVKKGIFRHQFDIYDLNIQMPENGIFVAFEKMRIEKNKVEKTSVNQQTGATESEISYAPKVMCYSVRKPFSFTFTGGKWHRNSNEDDLGKPFSFYEPSMTLQLSN